MHLTTRKITVSAVMAALIFIITFLIHIPVPGTSAAYINPGDAIIYLSAYIIGGVPAMFAAGIGSMLADIAGNAVVYAPATLVIKAVMGLVCGYMTVKPSLSRFVFACIVGGAVMVGGYGLFEYFYFGLAYAAGSVLFNLIQWAAGMAIAVVLYKPAVLMRKTYRFRKELGK